MSDPNGQRIVSLVPSLTELLYDLGLEEQVVGRTRFCIHPKDKIEGATIIGGTKNPDIEKIRELQPTLLITNKEENRKQDADALSQFSKVLVTEIATLSDAVQEIVRIGEATGTEVEAWKMAEKISLQLNNIPSYRPLRAAYMIWKEPWMSVGRDTFIHDTMKHYALENVFADKFRYPSTSPERLKALHPDVILLSSEPYPFKEKHISELKQLIPDPVIKQVDGEWFSWYGSRMLRSLPALTDWRAQLSKEL